MFIEPAGFAETRARGGVEHRLRSGEIAQKWQPLGVGAIEQEKERKALEAPQDSQDDSGEA